MSATFADASAALHDAVDRLRPLVDEHVTAERVRRYLRALSDVPAPSTAATALRTPVLKRLLDGDGALRQPGLHLEENFCRTGSTVILTGSHQRVKSLWYFAHLDTVSYLLQPRREGRYPLVPYGYHLMRDGHRRARAYRFDLEQGRYAAVAEGRLESETGSPYFRPDAPADLAPGDRVVFTVAYRETPDGGLVAHIDNAGAAAALAVAAPVLARAGVEAMLAFPDEEEGPRGSGNQMIGRGGTRIVGRLPAPELAVVGDVQQAGGGEGHADTRGGPENSTRLGAGAVLAEFASLGRGAVTPPHLYALARAYARQLQGADVAIQESNNAYTSRSDDVSVILKTPNVLLLGFAGFDRHFDLAEPSANLHDLVSLSRAYVYFSALEPVYRDLVDALDRR